MAEINHTTIQQAIEALLKADANVFNASSTDGSKLVNIEEGIPLASDIEPAVLPAAFITLDSERIKNKGAVFSNTVSVLEHEIRYRIRFVVADTGNKESENVLNILQKEILEVIEANNKLTNNVDSCFPESINRVQESASNPVFARDIIIKCIKTTN